ASIYHSFGKYSEASEILRQIIPIAQKMRSAADEAAYSRNLAVLLEYINGPSDEIIGLLERGITLLKSNRLSQDSSGKPLTEYYTFLAEMRAKTGGIRRFFKRRGR